MRLWPMDRLDPQRTAAGGSGLKGDVTPRGLAKISLRARRSAYDAWKQYVLTVLNGAQSLARGWQPPINSATTSRSRIPPSEDIGVMGVTIIAPGSAGDLRNLDTALARRASRHVAFRYIVTATDGPQPTDACLLTFGFRWNSHLTYGDSCHSSQSDRG